MTRAKRWVAAALAPRRPDRFQGVAGNPLLVRTCKNSGKTVRDRPMFSRNRRARERALVGPIAPGKAGSMRTHMCRLAHSSSHVEMSPLAHGRDMGQGLVDLRRARECDGLCVCREFCLASTLQRFYQVLTHNPA